MNPEPGPYWQDIVGDHWPTVGPEHWHTAAAIARDAASAMSDGAALDARHDFEGFARASVALEAVRDAMRVVQVDAERFADALAAAAAVVAEYGDLVYQVRHRLLDIVDDARRRIDAVTTDDPDGAAADEPGDDGADVDADSGDETDADADEPVQSAAITAILDEARAAVADVVDAAMRQVGASGTDVARIAGSLLELASVSALVVDKNLARNAVSTAAVGSITRYGAAGDGPVSTRSVSSSDGPSTVVSGDERPAAMPGPSRMTAGPAVSDALPARQLAAPDEGPVVDAEITAASAVTAPMAGIPPMMVMPGSAGVGATTSASERSPSERPDTAGTGSSELADHVRAIAETGSEDAEGQSSSGTELVAAEYVPSVRTALEAAVEAAAAPSFVVGERPDGDLVVARTLLSGVLSAAASSTVQFAAGCQWATAVLRGPGGVTIFATSNEGRGWLPTGMWLPREVTVPWVLDAELNGIGVRLDAIDDPARVLVEFAHAWSARTGARLSALASSGPIAERLAAGLGPEVSTVGEVSPTEDLDLRSPRDGLADRLEMSRAKVDLTADRIPEQRLWVACAELAVDAHRRVVVDVDRRITQMVSDVAAARGLRERILRGWLSGREVPEAWLAELRDADIMIEVAMRTWQVDAGSVAVGEMRADPGWETVRALTFERRCDELTFLLAVEPSRQWLRDAYYAHAQVVGHPFFAQTVTAAGTQPFLTHGKAGE